MDIKHVIAIFPRDRLEAVEQKLREVNVERVDVSKVRGYGEYRNFYTGDWMVDEVRVDVFTRRDEVDGVTAAIMAGAHSALPGAGIVAVVPVEKLFLIRTGAEATREEFWPKQAPEAAA